MLRTGLRAISITSSKALLAGLLTACALHAVAQQAPLPTGTGAPTPKEAEQIAAAGFIYGFPLLIMSRTADQLTAVEAPRGFQAPWNQFAHSAELIGPSFKAVAAMSTDVLYTLGWVDLSAGPVVVSVPESKGRYYALEAIDGWMNEFATIGTRTTGTGAGNYVFVGPGWQGSLPAGLKKFSVPTNLLWLGGQTQVNGPQDVAAANALQRQFKLTPLSAWGTAYTPPASVPIRNKDISRLPPTLQVKAMSAATFFGDLAALMQANPPVAADAPVVAQLARIGVAPGKPFDWNALNPELQRAIEAGAKSGFSQIEAAALKQDGSVRVNGWVIAYDLGEYGTNYFLRAASAYVGAGAAGPKDQLFPLSRVDGQGNAYDGRFNYVLRLSKEQIPPVNAFWSLTLYDEQMYMVQNPIGRQALASHQDKLKVNADGSLDLYIQKAPPPADQQANWLPAPDGPFVLMLRLWWPQQRALDRSWMPPPVQKVAGAGS